MASTPRPGPVTAVAVLNLLFGTIGLLSSLCCAGGLGGLVYLGNKTVPEFHTVNTHIDGQYPFLKYLLIGELSGGGIVATLLIVSGVGLLKMRPWARKFSIVTGICMIALSVTTAGCMIAQGNAALFKWLEQTQKAQVEMAARQNQPPPPAMPFGSYDPAMMIPGNVVSGIVDCTYPLILIWVMMTKRVRRAFAARAGLSPAEIDAGDLDRGWSESKS